MTQVLLHDLVMTVIFRWLITRSSTHHDKWFNASPEECWTIGHRTSKVPTIAFKNPFL